MYKKETDVEFIELDPKISHLDVPTINELMYRYYIDNEKVANLIVDYNLVIAPGSIVKILPPKVHEKNCIYCGLPLLENRKSKTDFARFPIYEKGKCPSCKHEDTSFCSCTNCMQMRRNEKQNLEARKRRAIEIAYDINRFSKVPEKELGLEDRLYLAAVLRAGMAEDFSYVLPLEDTLSQITPSSEFTSEVIRHLTALKILLPHPVSPTSAFVFSDNGEPEKYYIYKVNYHLNIEPIDGDYEQCVKHLLYPVNEDYSDGEFCHQMWKKIGLYEVLEYLLYSLNKVGFEFNPGKKTYAIIDYFLDHFSVGQIQGFIYSSVANATKSYQERNITKTHAANIVISSLEQRGNRSISEGWKVTTFKRNYDLPQSLISDVFFNTILQISNLGFSEVPFDIEI